MPKEGLSQECSIYMSFFGDDQCKDVTIGLLAYPGSDDIVKMFKKFDHSKKKAWIKVYQTPTRQATGGAGTATVASGASSVTLDFPGLGSIALHYFENYNCSTMHLSLRDIQPVELLSIPWRSKKDDARAVPGFVMPKLIGGCQLTADTWRCTCDCKSMVLIRRILLRAGGRLLKGRS